MIGCECIQDIDKAYNGLFKDSEETQYALVDISDIDIKYLNLSRSSPILFSLPTEIINTGSICNIPINENVKSLFTSIPELGILRNKKSNKMFPLPIACYNGKDFVKVSFDSIFGLSKKKIYNNCGEYYFFYKDFLSSVKEGGWVKEGGDCLIDRTDKKITHFNDRLLVDNEYGRYISGGINKYAIFIDSLDSTYEEESDTLMLNDDDINEYKDSCIFILFKNSSIRTPNILIKNYESFMPLSYFELDKKTLKDKYDVNNKNYMIK